tara:strand:+ start:223 stop:372 length:150 start_codon:yes stop_codon:yes gene_type:complete
LKKAKEKLDLELISQKEYDAIKATRTAIKKATRQSGSSLIIFLVERFFE